MMIVIVNSGMNVLDCFVYSGLKVLDYRFWIEYTGLLCQGSCGCLLMDSVWSIMDYGVTLVLWTGTLSFLDCSSLLSGFAWMPHLGFCLDNNGILVFWVGPDFWIVIIIGI